jgi:hypothetical protein
MKARIALTLLALAVAPASAGAAEVGVSLSGDGKLAYFSTDDPRVALAPPVQLSGLAAGETPQAIDFRPSNGQLYMLAVRSSQDTGHLYRVDTATGAATPVGGAIGSLSTDGWDLDFDPVSGQARVVGGGSGTVPRNLRLNADTGTVAGTDPAPMYAPGDVHYNGSNPVHLGAAAYSGNVPGAAQATLFVLKNGHVGRMGSVGGAPESASTGLVHTIGTFPTEDSVSAVPEALDISGATGQAYGLVLAEEPPPSLQHFLTFTLVDLDDGSVEKRGQTPFAYPIDMAIVPSKAAVPGASGSAGGSPGATGGPSSGPSAGEGNAAPLIESLGVTNRVFAAAAGRRARGARKVVPRGTSLRYRLSENARVTIALLRRAPGRRVGKKCKLPARKLAKRPRCERLVRKGTLTAAGKAGANTVRFDGRVKGRALPPGRYVAKLTATDSAGGKSAPRTVAFRIVAASGETSKG